MPFAEAVIPGWAWALGAATVGIGGAALVASATNSASAPAAPAAPSPPATSSASPIPIVQGHRYQVTLTFGAAPSPADMTTALGSLQAGLSNVAAGEYSLVSASSPTATQIVYVVDAIGGAPGSSHEESPQTFYADLNAATMGGIGVGVQDLGASPGSPAASAGPGGAPSPGAPPPALPGGSTSPPPPTPPPTLPPPVFGPPVPQIGVTVAGQLGPSSLVTDPALVSYGQSALLTLNNKAVIQVPGGVFVNGNGADAQTLAAVAAFQKITLVAAQQSGQLDYLTWAIAILDALITTGAVSGTDETLTDAPSVQFAQSCLALAIGNGTFPNIDYGQSEVSGAIDTPWTAALGTAMGQANATLGQPIFPSPAVLDLLTFAFLIAGAFHATTTLANGVTPVRPATPVTNATEVEITQGQLQAASTVNAGFSSAGVVINGILDAPTVAAVRAYQAGQVGLQHRTTPGVLDTITFAALVSAALSTIHAGTPAGATLATIQGGAVTDPNVIAGAQSALVVLASGTRLGSPSPIAYTEADVDGNAATQSFVTAWQTAIAKINAAGGASFGFQYNASGTFDYYDFAALFTLAYL